MNAVVAVVAAAAFFRGARAFPVFFFRGTVSPVAVTLAEVALSAVPVSAFAFPLSVRFEAIAFQSIHHNSSRASASRFCPLPHAPNAPSKSRFPQNHQRFYTPVPYAGSVRWFCRGVPLGRPGTMSALATLPARLTTLPATRRSVAEVSPPSPSNPSDDSRPYPRRYRRGNIRRTKSSLSNADRAEKFGAARPPAAFRPRPFEDPRSGVARISAATSHRVHSFPEPGGALHLKVVAKIMMKLLQRFDQQKIHRKPHRPAPIGIAAEECRRRFRRLIVHPLICPFTSTSYGLSM